MDDIGKDEFRFGAVTFLDVLGWKGIWQVDKKAIDKLNNLIKKTKWIATSIVKKYQKIANEKDVRTVDISIKVMSISDTIALFTEGKAETAIRLHAELCSWILRYALEQGFLLRGAISCGKFDESSNVMIGPAVDEAAAWHESTDWIGVILTPSAQMYLKNKNIDFIVCYDKIPFKRAIKYLDKCVKWDYGDRENLYNVFIQKGPHMQEVAPKYLNTLEFLERANREEV